MRAGHRLCASLGGGRPPPARISRGWWADAPSLPGRAGPLPPAPSEELQGRPASQPAGRPASPALPCPPRGSPPLSSGQPLRRSVAGPSGRPSGRAGPGAGGGGCRRGSPVAPTRGSSGERPRTAMAARAEGAGSRATSGCRRRAPPTRRGPVGVARGAWLGGGPERSQDGGRRGAEVPLGPGAQVGRGARRGAGAAGRQAERGAREAGEAGGFGRPGPPGAGWVAPAAARRMRPRGAQAGDLRVPRALGGRRALGRGGGAWPPSSPRHDPGPGKGKRRGDAEARLGRCEAVSGALAAGRSPFAGGAD